MTLGSYNQAPIRSHLEASNSESPPRLPTARVCLPADGNAGLPFMPARILRNIARCVLGCVTGLTTGAEILPGLRVIPKSLSPPGKARLP